MTGDELPSRRRSRRDEYAQQTRDAVISSARQLFAEHGFVSTTVDDIADLSRVSAGTVYQQCGGKQGLLRTLMTMWTSAPLMRELVDRIHAAGSGAEVLDALADAYLETYCQFGDIVRLSVATAPHDDQAAACLREVIAANRAALVKAAQKLRALGALSKTSSDEDVADTAEFYFGTHNGIQFLSMELGWPPKRARDWIVAQFARSLEDVTDADSGLR